MSYFMSGRPLKVLVIHSALEFIIGFSALFVVFSVTGQDYWHSGPRSAMQTIGGAFVVTLIFEGPLLYLPVALVVRLLVLLTSGRAICALVTGILVAAFGVFWSATIYADLSPVLIVAVATVSIADAALMWWLYGAFPKRKDTSSGRR